MDLPGEIREAFPARPPDSDKRSVGTVAVVGGSRRFAHAPAIAGLGARAAGAGLVQLVVPDASRMAAGCLVPEATFLKLTATCTAPRADVIVVGMGLGVSSTSEAIVTRLLSGSPGRFVVDADALAVLASWCGGPGGYEPQKGQQLVLTPHEGEAARLLGWERVRISSDRRAAAKEIAGRYHATTVLKGRHTLVVSADGARIYENATGNPFMALGGMGDLLAGVAGARWAYLGDDPFTAAASAVWLHGLASDEVVAEGQDPSLANTAAHIGSLRVRLEGKERNA